MTEEGEASLYANLDYDKPRSVISISSEDSLSSTSLPSATTIRTTPPRNGYDEITINFGKPVIQPPSSATDDVFASVTFSSPMVNDPGGMVPPVPAPRLSKQKHLAAPTTCDILEETSNADDIFIPQEPPKVPPRNLILRPEVLYQEIEEAADEFPVGDELPSLLGARPRQSKADTIDIRNTISQWYDEASDEIERDLTLDLSVLELESASKISSVSPPSAIKEEEFEDEIFEENEVKEKGAVGQVVMQNPTLLRHFDPILENDLKSVGNKFEVNNEALEQEESFEQRDELKGSVDKENGTPQVELRKPENYYVALPFDTSLSRHSGSSSTYTPSPEPPTSPPPPLPLSEPPTVSLPPVSYENIWIDPVSKRTKIMSDSVPIPPPVPPRQLRPKQPSFLASRTNEDSAISSSASSSSNDVHALSNNSRSATPPQRSFSALNLATKFAANIKRKMSDQNLVASRVSQPRVSIRTKSALLSPTSGTAYQSNLKTRSGVLYVYSRSRRNFQPKWCVLNHADFRYFNDKQTVAIPKETVPVTGILSLRRHESTAFAHQQVEIYTFDVCYLTNKFQTLTLGAATASERDKWMDKIIYNLDVNLEGLGSATKLTWVQLKTGFAGTWAKSWIHIDTKKEGRWLKYTEEMYNSVQIDLKKIKNLTLVKDVKNLAAPLSHNLPILVLDCLDRSLYLQSSSEREAINLKETIESVAFSNTNSLHDQQLTSDDIPVIVEKCISFVYGHGCMTEGIYRHSGVNTKINRLLELFKGNVWSVPLTRDSFSEHDVANALKRFFRTLSAPILTEKLRPMFLQAAAVEDVPKKIERYRNLVHLLPEINKNTLRKLVSHLVAIASHSGKNLMPNYNLGAIWGPSLLTVDTMQASTYAQTSSESDVCRDLIDNYKLIFNVNDDELKKEAIISETLEKINKFDRGRCLLKRSGKRFHELF